jgi:hypothetical protein
LGAAIYLSSRLLWGVSTCG